MSRFGSIVVIVGATIGLRRHFRLGAKSAEESVPPFVIDNQFNPSAVNETLFREGDLELQSRGLWIAVCGTFIWGYADAIFQLVYPL